MNVKIVAVIGLFAIAIACALGLTFAQGGMEYRTFPELASEKYDGERVKMKVQVTLIESKGEKAIVFQAVDIPPDPSEQKPDNRPRGAGKVVFTGDEPQGFKLGCHATLEGRFDKSKGAFVATHMQTQCPSKYEGQETPKPPSP